MEENSYSNSSYYSLGSSIPPISSNIQDQEEEEAISSPLPPPVVRSDADPTWPRRTSSVMLEGYVELSEGADLGSDGGDSSVVGRTKSLTDEDLEELKGCLDLGFGFNYEEIPELCNTLPALELCYSMSQRFLDEQHQQKEAAERDQLSNVSSAGAPIANWKISSPGDHPEEVKARLKYWAQAVACTVRLCS